VTSSYSVHQTLWLFQAIHFFVVNCIGPGSTDRQLVGWFGKNVAILPLLPLYSLLQVSLTLLKPIDGYTPQQRFFLAHGQIWCQNVTPRQARVLAITDPHSSGRWLVNGAVQNSAAFQEANSCKDSQPMGREPACRVW
jgi:hypothetical protein